VFARRNWILALTLVMALGLAACGGSSQKHKAGGEATGFQVANANNNGGYVDAGPVTYQLQISRVLNQYSTEDSQYVKGLSPGTAPPTATQVWYGVFLWAKNQTSEPQTTTDKFVVEDTENNKYYPIPLNPAENPYAWTSQTLQPLGTEPGPDTTANFGPTQGGLLLFKISTSAYANRPLTLYILSPQGQKRLASISLDL
jgi:hypothetical protein